jgi:hypothetical protein
MYIQLLNKKTKQSDVYDTYNVIDTRICCAARNTDPMLAVKKIATSKIQESRPSRIPLSSPEKQQERNKFDVIIVLGG